MEIYEQIADDSGLDEQTKARFIKYMRIRWGNPSDEKRHCMVGYASEWAERFKVGMEFNCSDESGRAVLRTMEV